MRDIFTDMRTRSNSFIEALHVLHETLATNNCFPARACWHFLISKAHHPVEITPVACSVSPPREDKRGGRFNEGIVFDSSIIDTLLWIQSIPFNNPNEFIRRYKYFGNDFHSVIRARCNQALAAARGVLFGY